MPSRSGTYRNAAILTPLQRFYVAPYVRNGLKGRLAFTTNGRYRLLQVVDGDGSRLALDDEVRPISRATGDMTPALTEAAVAAGDRQLVWQDRSYSNVTLHAFLDRWVYHDQTVADLLMHNPVGRPRNVRRRPPRRHPEGYRPHARTAPRDDG